MVDALRAVIRLGTPADHEALAVIFRRASLSNAEDRPQLLAHPEYLELGAEGLAQGRTWVAEVDGAPVGFASWLLEPDGFELDDLFVDPAWTRRGIASSLVERIVEVVCERGGASLHVTANGQALGFYQSAGFVETGSVATHFAPAIRMTLTFV